VFGTFYFAALIRSIGQYSNFLHTLNNSVLYQQEPQKTTGAIATWVNANSVYADREIYDSNLIFKKRLVPRQ